MELLFNIFRRRKTGTVGLVLVLFAWFCPVAASADPFFFDGTWRQRETGGDAVESTSSFEQLYNLGFDKALSAGTDFSANVRYNDVNPSDSPDQSLFNPSLTFDVRNDWSVLNLNGSTIESKSDDRPTINNKSWNANWFSLVPDLPKLRLSYGQNFTDDDASPRVLDVESENFVANLLHDWELITFSYDYRYDSTEDKVNRITSETDTHLSQITYGQNFLESRLNVNASGQVSYREFKRELETVSGIPRFIALPSVVQGLSAADDTPAFGALANQNGLINGNFVGGVVEILQSAQDQNLGLQTGLQAIGEIRVFLDRTIPAATQTQLSWQVYTSSNNLNWNQVFPVSVSYVDEFVVTAPATVIDISLPSTITAQYIKVVVDSPGAPAVAGNAFVTELQPGNLVSGFGETISESSDTLNYKTNLSVTYRPSSRWSVSYTGDYNRREVDSADVSWTLFQSVGATYAISPSMSISSGVSENRDNNEGLPERIIRSYSVSLNDKPLSTVDYSLGFTRTDSYEESNRESTSDLVNFNAIALLFPDLSANFNGAWGRTNSFESDSKSINYSGSLTLTARLSPKLNLDFNYDYSRTDTEVGSGDEDVSSEMVFYGVGANYRPSDLLSLQGNLDWDEDSARTIFNGSFFWRLTRKIETNGGVFWVLRGEDEKAYNLGLNYAISPHFNLDNRYSIRILEGVDEWDFFTQFNVQL